MEIVGLGKTTQKPNNKISRQYRFDDLLSETTKNLNSNLELNKNYFEYNVENLKSARLEEDSLFKELKGKLIQFENNVNQKAQNEGKKIYSTYEIALYGCLQKMLYDIILTADEVIQKFYLAKVYNWFIKKIGEKSGLLSITAPPNLQDPNCQKNPQQNFDLRNFSGKKFYEEKLRTLHPDINPPKERIEKFQRKILNKTIKNVETPHIDIPKKVIEKKPNNEEENSKLKEPKPEVNIVNKGLYNNQLISNNQQEKSSHISNRSNYMNYISSNKKIEQKLEKLWFSKRNLELSKKRENEELKDFMGNWRAEKSNYQSNILKKQENQNFSSEIEKRNQSSINCQVEHGKNIDYKKQYEELSESNSSGNEKNATHLIDKDKEQISESPLKNGRLIQKRRLINRNQRNIQVINPLSTMYLNNTTKETAVPNEDASLVIPNSNRKRIEKIRFRQGKLIKAENNSFNPDDNIFLSNITKDKAVPLSLYTHLKFKSRGRLHDNFALLSKVPLTHRLSYENIRNGELDEINKMQLILSKNRIPCSGNILKRVILTPEGYSNSKLTYENLILPGSHLMVNPFLIKKKKKKGKKKKRRN